MMAIGVVGLLQVRSAQDFLWVWWWTIWWGLGWGGNMTAMLALFASYYGPKVYGQVFGVRCSIVAIGGVIGPIMGGWIFDVTGNYILAFWVLIVVLIIAMIMYIFAAPPKVEAAKMTKVTV